MTAGLRVRILFRAFTIGPLCRASLASHLSRQARKPGSLKNGVSGVVSSDRPRRVAV